MSLQEAIHEQEPTLESCASRVATEVRENLDSYLAGERPSFSVEFPLNIAELDVYGKGVGVNDLAHNEFLDKLPFNDIVKDRIVLEGDVPLYFQFDYYENDERQPFNARYSTSPFTHVSESAQ